MPKRALTTDFNEKKKSIDSEKSKEKSSKESVTFGTTQSERTGEATRKSLMRRPSAFSRADPSSAKPGDTKDRGRPTQKVIHLKWQCSPLSLKHKGTSYQGFYVLFIIVTICMNLRLMIENVIKHGILLRPPQTFIHDLPACFACCGIMSYCILVSWAIEQMVPAKKMLSGFLMGMHIVNCALIFILPGLVVWFMQPDFLLGAILLSFSIVWTGKVVSFIHCAHDIRSAQIEGCDFITHTVTREMVPKFPKCVSLKDMLMFIMYPTLCFQLDYPRSERVRKSVILKHLLQLAVSISLMWVILEQYVAPILEGAKEYLDANDKSWSHVAGGLMERMLKLSIPNLYIWLMMFFSLFHVYLNMLAELTRFADRKFYEDWWNAPDFATYWAKWNLPIHCWLQRHVYAPCLRRGRNKVEAGLVVFLLSGLLHEYLVFVPLHLERPTFLVFAAFVAQLPLIVFTYKIRRHRLLGNVIFWIVFCFTGQPLAVLIYFFIKMAPEYADTSAVFRYLTR